MIQKLMSLAALLSVFGFANSAYAQRNDVIAQCKVQSSDFNLTYTLHSDFTSHLTGKVLDEPVSCALDYERIKDERRTPSIVNYRVYNYRKDENCNKNLSFDLKRGIEDNITLVIYQKRAEIFLFEGFKALPCQAFNYKESQIIKGISHRGLNSVGLSKNRKTVKLKLNSINTSEKRK